MTHSENAENLSLNSSWKEEIHGRGGLGGGGVMRGREVLGSKLRITGFNLEILVTRKGSFWRRVNDWDGRKTALSI